MLFLIFLTISYLSFVAAECPNACSAHGKCTNYDMCLCYRNWMANDCSERMCQFGTAHVDTPKGDLDASGGALSGPNTRVVYNSFMYSKGTTEQYPEASDLDGLVLRDTAHEYRECSNKGICDRSSGTCACFDGYDGSACQRASCPSSGDGVCSGHGTCQSITEIAANDYGNIYSLWDKDITMGCVCDGGFSGPDCSEKICKYGEDPLYYDGPQNVRYSNFTYQFYTHTNNVCLTGNYSITFYDTYGEDWQTEPIDAHASCEVVTAALERLPNNVVPEGSVKCYKYETTTTAWDATLNCIKVTAAGQFADGIEPIYDAAMFVHAKYTIAFPSNPGELKQIAINKYLDGSRPTLFTNEVAYSTLGWKIYANGFTGEEVDVVPTLCEDVLVSIDKVNFAGYHALAGLTSAEAKLLKICLGDGNGNTADNVEVYNWDYGSVLNPHLIKLIDATQDTTTAIPNDLNDITYDFQLTKYPISNLCSKSATNRAAGSYLVDTNGIAMCADRNRPGFYASIYWDGTSFRIFNRAGGDYAPTTQFYVFTTNGYLQNVNPNSGVFTTSNKYSTAINIDKYYTNILHQANVTSTNAGFHGNMDCETNPIGHNGALDCINKGDHIMILNTALTANGLASNPYYPNIYEVQQIVREEKALDTYPSNPFDEKIRNIIKLDYGMNANYKWYGVKNAHGYGLNAADTTASVFKFHADPTNADGGYLYATQCSNRGICNQGTGDCQCFPGFSGDNCAIVNALAG